MCDGGRVPRDMAELEKLPGVGHKTASVVMTQAFGELLPESAGEDVGRAAGGKRHDEADRAGRVGLCVGGGDERGEEKRGETTPALRATPPR